MPRLIPSGAPFGSICSAPSPSHSPKMDAMELGRRMHMHRPGAGVPGQLTDLGITPAKPPPHHLLFPPPTAPRPPVPSNCLLGEWCFQKYPTVFALITLISPCSDILAHDTLASFALRTTPVTLISKSSIVGNSPSPTQPTKPQELRTPRTLKLCDRPRYFGPSWPRYLSLPGSFVSFSS